MLLIARAFLARALEPQSSVPTWAASIAEPVIKAFRGIVALCCPLPGLHGCGLNDVKYLFPEVKNQSPPIAVELLRVGKVLVNEVKGQSGVGKSMWPMWRERYYEHAGVEATKGPELMNLYDEADAVLATHVELQTDSSTDSRQMVILRGQKVAVVQKYVSKHMSFGVLRPGATAELQDLLLQFMEDDWDASADCETFLSEQLPAYSRALRAMTVTRARPLLQAFEDKLQKDVRSRVIAQLRETCEEMLRTSDVASLGEFARAIQSVAAYSDIRDEERDLLKCLEKAVIASFCFLDVDDLDVFLETSACVEDLILVWKLSS